MEGYLPRKDSELVAWSSNFVAVLTQHYSEWEVPMQDISDLQILHDNFSLLHEQADSPNKTSVIVAEKNEARKLLTEKIRGLVDFRLKNPVITDAQRIALGLHAKSPSPTPVPIPTTRPELVIEVVDIRRLQISFHDQGSKTKARPYGTNGAVVVYSILDTPPTSINELAKSVLATRTPHIFEFKEEERGKTVYLAICWQNEKGQRGPFSEIEKAIVP
ncbi:MAG: hypothetical protein LBJ00_00300 [Planctomycetaceae bacterium]|jgi:hypothetical protein|nr:hypothetical protein [Planctomycetaceae bacterium]